MRKVKAREGKDTREEVMTNERNVDKTKEKKKEIKPRVERERRTAVGFFMRTVTTLIKRFKRRAPYDTGFENTNIANGQSDE